MALDQTQDNSDLTCLRWSDLAETWWDLCCLRPTVSSRNSLHNFFFQLLIVHLKKSTHSFITVVSSFMTFQFIFSRFFSNVSVVVKILLPLPWINVYFVEILFTICHNIFFFFYLRLNEQCHLFILYFSFNCSLDTAPFSLHLVPRFISSICFTKPGWRHVHRKPSALDHSSKANPDPPFASTGEMCLKAARARTHPWVARHACHNWHSET